MPIYQLSITIPCPCSDGAAIHPVILLAIVVGLWLLGRWVKLTIKKQGVSTMNKMGKIGIVIALVVIVTALLIAKQIKTAPEATITDNSDQNMAQPDASPASATETTEKPRSAKALPRLVDLGADKCIPCKMMAPILEELKQKYAGRLQVDFIDVWKNPDAGKEYSIKLIPTQIFFDASGKELFRHEGFMSKEDILSKWEKLGINLEKG